MTDIVERLRNPPTNKDDNDEWFRFNETLALLNEAADTIERLRSLAGKADVGSSFSELTSELRHQTLHDDRVND